MGPMSSWYGQIFASRPNSEDNGITDDEESNTTITAVESTQNCEKYKNWPI